MARTPAKADYVRDALALLEAWLRIDHEATAVILDNADLLGLVPALVSFCAELIGYYEPDPEAFLADFRHRAEQYIARQEAG